MRRTAESVVAQLVCNKIRKGDAFLSSEGGRVDNLNVDI